MDGVTNHFPLILTCLNIDFLKDNKIKKILLLVITALSITTIMADEDINTINTNNKYINHRAYLQNPYGSLLSGGATNQNPKTNWYENGTWNLMSNAVYNNVNGANNYGYGWNLFAQSGQIAGFSLGGLLTIANPFFAAQLSPSNEALEDQFQPVDKQQQLSEAFIEYQYQNKIQTNIGYISITNSPWLSPSFFEDMLTPGVSYQGAEINVNLGQGWLISALGFNQTQVVGEEGFGRQTFYNPGFDYGTGTANVINDPSYGTYALGANFIGLNNNYNFRLWAYQFTNYAKLLYADNNVEFKINQQLNFKVAAQVGNENGDKVNALTHNGYGNVNSSFVGIQGGINYYWAGLSLAYNNVWGPDSSYGGGAIVSPYTYQLASDPLYTTPVMLGLVDKGSAGSAYKITPSLNFLDGNLSFTPSYSSFSTVSVPDTKEYDLVLNYAVAAIKGLSFYVAYAYLSQPYYLNNQNAEVGGSAYITQVSLNYLY